MRIYSAALFLVSLPSLTLFAAPNRIPSALSSGELRVLPGNTHRLANAQFDQGDVNPAMRLDHVMMLMKPTAGQQAEIEQLLLDQQNPSSASYHQWLTPEQFADRFGLSFSDQSKIVAWLAAQGLSVHEPARGRNWIAFSGSAAQVSRAFRTSIHRYLVNGETHYANSTAPSVPAGIADLVGGFIGLNDFTPKSQARVEGPPNFTSGNSHYLAPGDWSTIYNVTPLTAAGYDGTGQNIAVVGQSDIILSDISSFRTDFGLPVNAPKLVLFGSDPGFNGAQIEANLDLEWSGAMAPRATISYVYGTNAFSALTYAVAQNIAPVISVSYATCENDVSPIYRSVAQQANAQGITISVASGDSGAAGCDIQGDVPLAAHGFALQFPGNLPEVTAMGGTMFDDGGGTYWGSKNAVSGGSALGYIPEVVWNENGLLNGLGASGGGASATIAKPNWQTGPGVPADGARDTPDLSLSSAGHDGYLVTYQGNNLYVVGGTSAAAPSMAGILAILNQYVVKQGIQKTAGLGNINPQLYRMAQAVPTAFHDIVGGDNKVPCVQGSPDCVLGSYGIAAGPGYDQATGLGSIDANVFVTSWKLAVNPVSVTLTSSASVLTFNDSVTLTATVVPGQGSGTPTGTVTFVSLQQNLGTVPVVNIAGSQSATITVPAWMLGTGSTIPLAAEYNGDAAFSTGGATVTVRVTLPTTPGVAAVTVSVPSTVFAFQTGNQPMTWQAGISLRELAGVPAVLTGFTIDGVKQALEQVFPSANIPARGSLTATVVLKNLPVPVIKTFGFTGTDLSGAVWSRQVQVVFRGQFVEAQVNFNLWATPLTIQQNPRASTNCLYPQQVTLDELTGYELHIIGLFQGSVDITKSTAALFGTTRLAPWGSLQSTLCWNPAVTPSSDLLQVYMEDDFGDVLVQEVNVNFTGPAPAVIQLSASPESVSIRQSPLLVPVTPSTVSVKLSDQTQTWTANIFPANRTTAWLSLSQYAGTGTSSITLRVNMDGMGPGVYRATIVLQSPNSVPQFVAVPVMLVFGGFGVTEVSSVVNALSFTTPVSPGMIMAVYGTQLANSTKAAAGLPLTNSLDGVSVTVNGWPAPLYYISPGQLNIQVPYEVGAGPAVLGVNNNGQVGGIQFQLSPAAPGILTFNGSVYPGSPAKAGGFATMYLTGAGELSQPLPSGVSMSASVPASSLPVPLLPLNVLVGGSPALVQFAGATAGVVGLIQVNFVVPPTVNAGVQSVVAIVGGYPSAPANLTVTAP